MQKFKNGPESNRHIRKINVRSDCSDSYDGKDNQARGKPVVVDITSDQEIDIDQQPKHFNPLKKT